MYVIVFCVSSKILALSDFFLIPSSFVPHSYANSVLRALYFCSPFRDLVIQSMDISAPPLPAAVSRQTPPTLPTAYPILPCRNPSEERQHPTSRAPHPNPRHPLAPPTLFSTLCSLYAPISRKAADKGAIPRAFIDKLRNGNENFRGVMHQDVHEFLSCLL
jgi:ubiquitin carboxyl-terminal hydrolase 9/13